MDVTGARNFRTLNKVCGACQAHVTSVIFEALKA